VIRSALDYARYFAACLGSSELRAVLAGQKRPLGVRTNVVADVAMRALVEHLLRAQRHGNDAGMGSYHLVNGWGASYPETTGYAIPTLLAVGEHLAWKAPMEAALRAAEWLLSVQRPDGGWQGGRVGEERPSIVFNTAQVIRGLLAAHAHSRNSDFLEAAVRAGDWIVSTQDTDGSWRSSNFLGVARVYDSYVSAPMLHLHEVTGKPMYRNTAMKNLEWVLSRQRTNGWFMDADNTIKHNDRPITHTMAYTIDGLLECHARTGEQRFLEAALQPARRLADLFLERGQLNGRYDRDWSGSEASITTGSAQMAIVWYRAFDRTHEALFKDAAERMIAWLAAVQEISTLGPKDMHGAVTGSFPVWGRYEKFACPNWAQKYMADAFLCSKGILPSH